MATSEEWQLAWASVPAWLIFAIVFTWSAGVALVTLVLREACCGGEVVQEVTTTTSKRFGYKTHVV